MFNALLTRLGDSFKGMRQFMADASHELRTPLSIIRGEADIALSQNRDAVQYREALEIIQDEAARLSRIVEDMLELARADAGQRPLNTSRFYVNDVVEECCRSMHVLSTAKGVTLAMIPTPDIAIIGDEDLIRRMAMNLLDNAVKYTPAGGSVLVRLARRPGPRLDPTLALQTSTAPSPGPKSPTSPSLGPHASLRAKPQGPESPPSTDTVDVMISDTGIGVPAELVTNVFHRFYRADQARTEHPRGTGLGLAIARWIAEAHGGSITLGSPKGSGSTFTVSLSAEI